MRRPFTKLLPFAAFFAAIAAPAFARADKPVLLDKIVAVADDTTIYRSEVLSRAKPFIARLPESQKRPADIAALYRELLHKMIDDVLITADAERQHLSVSDMEIDRAVDVIANTNKISRKELEAEVAKSGMTSAEYHEELRHEILDAKWTQLKIRSRVKPPPDSAKMTDQEREKAMMMALEIERKKAIDELRARSFVEVRW